MLDRILLSVKYYKKPLIGAAIFLIVLIAVPTLLFPPKYIPAEDGGICVPDDVDLVYGGTVTLEWSLKDKTFGELGVDRCVLNVTGETVSFVKEFVIDKAVIFLYTVNSVEFGPQTLRIHVEFIGDNVIYWDDVTVYIYKPRDTTVPLTPEVDGSALLVMVLLVTPIIYFSRRVLK